MTCFCFTDTNSIGKQIPLSYMNPQTRSKVKDDMNDVVLAPFDLIYITIYFRVTSVPPCQGGQWKFNRRLHEQDFNP